MSIPGRPPAIFRLYLSGQTASFVAYQMLSVAVGWHIYDLTKSPLVLGFVGLAQFLPQLLLTLVVGHVADRYDRRGIIRVCQAVEALTAAALALGSLTGHLGPYGILACSVVIGAARAFEYPSLLAFLPALVGDEALPRCLALSAAGRQTGIILGPARGGVLCLVAPEAAYGAAAAFSLTALVLFSLLRPALAPVRRDPASLRFLFEGISFVRSRPDILGAISLDLFSVLLGGATALLPLYAQDILSVGPVGLGALRSAPAAGAIAMSLVLARWPLTRGVGRRMFWSVAVFGAATVVFGLSRSFALSLAALAVLGAADNVSVVVRSSLVQLDTPEAMRGRVSAINAVFIGTSNQLGEFESGVTAAWFGAVPAVVLGGVLTMVVVLLWTRLFPGLLARETLRENGNGVQRK